MENNFKLKSEKEKYFDIFDSSRKESLRKHARATKVGISAH